MTNNDDRLLCQDDLATKDDDNESENVNKTREHGSHHPLKVEAKIDISTFDGTIDAEKLDSWLDQLETYFTLYGFRSSDKVVFARLKLTSHALAWWNSQLKIMDNEEINWKKFTQLLRQEFYRMGYVQDRWTQWHNLRLQRGQTVQEYTTEFRRLAMTLGIAIYNVDIFTKYVVGLPLQIQNEMRLHMITNISNASSIAMAIEQKNKDGGRKFKEGLKGEGSNSSHHMKDYRKKGKWIKDDHGRPTTATTFVDDVIELESVKEADKSLSLMAKSHMKSSDTHVKRNEKEELFTMKIQVKHEVIEAIVDTDEVICKVVLLDICHVIFGSPYLWERNAVYLRRAQKYQFEKDGKKFLINRNNDVGNIKLITACQARRMVNASQAVLLSLARPMASSNKLQIMEHEKKKRHKKKDKQSKANESAPNELESTQALVQKLLSENKNLVEKVNLLNAELDQKSATSRSSILVKPYDPMIKIHSAEQDITTHREKILFENTIVERKTSSTRPSADPLFWGKGRHDP
ncbi:hypothetical protein Tco_1337006 [Tanacetum coccineum]